MEQWVKYIEENFGSMEEFNKLDYCVRYAIWEEYMNE